MPKNRARVTLETSFGSVTIEWRQPGCPLDTLQYIARDLELMKVLGSPDPSDIVGKFRGIMIYTPPEEN